VGRSRKGGAVDPDEYRRQSLEGWEQVAPGWEARHAFLWECTRHVGAWLVDHLDPRPGETVLELAAGPGTVGLLAAARLGPTGRLICTDFSPAMLAVARRRAAALGLANVEFRLVDAERMELDDGCVDGVLCRWGYMLMADPARALAETRRVLRPAGRLAFAVWGPLDRNPWSEVPGRVLVERGLAPGPEPHAPGPFSLGDPERVRAMVREAGFADPLIEEVPVVWRYPDFERYWETTVDLSPALVRSLSELPSEGARAELREALREALGPYRAGAGYEVPGVTYCVATS
jgi:SAM-dependent methyltransferase